MRARLFATPLLVTALIAAALIGAGASTAQATEPEGEDWYSEIKIDNLNWATSDVYATPGQRLPASVTTSNAIVRLNQRVGATWVTVQEFTVTSEQKVQFQLPAAPAYTTPVTSTAYRLSFLDPRSNETLDGDIQNVRVIKGSPYAVSSKYKHRAGTIGRTLARWNPCTAVTYKVDVRKAPGSNTKALNVIQQQMNYLSKVSRLTFHYAGTVKSDASKNGDASTDLTIAWAPYKSKTEIGHAWMNAESVGNLPFMKIDRAKVVLKSNTKAHLSDGKVRSLILHETMHAIGVRHSTSKADIMYKFASTQRWLGDGDKEAMRLVGGTNGCF